MAERQDGGSARRQERLTLEGHDLRLDYDLGRGTWSLQSTDERSRFRLDATARVSLRTRDGGVEQRDATAGSLGIYEVEPTDPGRPARWLRVERTWPDGTILVQRFELDADRPAGVSEVTLRPPPRASYSLRALLPLAPPDQGEGNLALSADPRALRVLDVGWTASRPARVLALGDGGQRTGDGVDEGPEDRWAEWDDCDDPESAEGGQRSVPRPLPPVPWIVATGLAALGDAAGNVGLTTGFLDASRAIGHFRFRADGDSRTVEVESVAWFGAVDLDGGEHTSVPLWLSFEPVEDALQHFAELWRERHPRTRPAPTLSHWCRGALPDTSSGPGPTGRAVLAVLDATATSPVGCCLEGAALSAGWVGSVGEEAASPEGIPGHLIATRNALRARGLRAGLSLAPFRVGKAVDALASRSRPLREAPPGGPAPADEAGTTDRLDPGDPEVREWFRGLGRRIAVEWGLDLVELEHLADGVVGDGARRRRESPIEAYRAALAAFRSELGDCPIVAAGAPLFATLDLVDSLRADDRPLRRADPSRLLRSFLGRAGPAVSAGPLVVNGVEQTLDEARAAATIASLGGGALAIVGCGEPLSTEHARILGAALPPLHGAVVPFDVFAPEGPRLFGARFSPAWEDWLLLVALNPAASPATLDVPYQTLRLTGPHHAFEFWSQAYLGIVDDRLTLASVTPGGCAVVALRPAQDVPQVIGTSLHLTQGGCELHDAGFDRATGRLDLTLALPGERSGTVTLATPPGWAPASVRGTGGHFDLETVSDRLFRIALDFRDVADVEVDFLAQPHH